MENKKGLRQFVEALVNASINYRLIGDAYNKYFTSIFTIYNGVIDAINNEIKKDGKINKRKYNEIRDLIVTNIVDLGTPTDTNRIKTGFERIKYRYEESTTEEEESINEGKLNIGKYVRGILAASALIGVAFSAYKGISTMKREREKQRSLIMSFTHGTELYRSEIFPKLEQILDDIIFRKIKNKQRLKHAFYKAIDIVSDNHPQLRPYLQAWGAGI